MTEPASLQDNPDAARERARERASQENQRLRAAVFGHYGWACACCGSTENPSIDHCDGQGRKHRIEIFGTPSTGGYRIYRWLVRNGFPEGFQTLCCLCNTSKGTGPHCRLDHTAREAPAETMSLEPGFEVFSGALYWVEEEPQVIPKLAGVAEVAALAGVSKQRAAQIVKLPGFPEPVDVLAMGPVWREENVKAFLAKPRPAGRPRKNPEGT